MLVKVFVLVAAVTLFYMPNNSWAADCKSIHLQCFRHIVVVDNKNKDRKIKLLYRAPGCFPNIITDGSDIKHSGTYLFKKGSEKTLKYMATVPTDASTCRVGTHFSLVGEHCSFRINRKGGTVQLQLSLIKDRCSSKIDFETETCSTGEIDKIHSCKARLTIS